VIAPAPRPRREPPVPRELVAELASLLATAYLRLRTHAAADHVRTKEASDAGEGAGMDQRTLRSGPVEPCCDDPTDRPPARRST